MNHFHLNGHDSKYTHANHIKDYKFMIVLAVVVFLITALFCPEFYSYANISNLARQASIVGIVAVGITFVMLTGGIDLSVGAVLAISGVLFAHLLNLGYAVWFGILVSVIAGLLFGLLNGIGMTFFGLQPFVMTLATMAIGNGIALLLSKGAPIDFKSTSVFVELMGNGSVAGIPGPVILFILAAVVAGFVLKVFPYGRYVYAVGGNLIAARLSGIKTTRILLSVYAISGVCAALSGIIITNRLYVGHPTAGNFIMLDSIAAVVIGGTSLMGGKGTIAGTVAGAFLLAMIANVLNLLGVSPYNQQVAKGLIIIVTIILTTPNLKQRIKEQWAGM